MSRRTRGKGIAPDSRLARFLNQQGEQQLRPWPRAEVPHALKSKDEDIVELCGQASEVRAGLEIVRGAVDCADRTADVAQVELAGP